LQLTNKISLSSSTSAQVCFYNMALEGFRSDTEVPTVCHVIAAIGHFRIANVSRRLSFAIT